MHALKSTREEHDRLIIQHNLNARVKHRFRLRKGTDRETIARRARLSRNEGSPRLDPISVYSESAIVKPIRSSRGEIVGWPAMFADSQDDSCLALVLASRVEIHLRLPRSLYLNPCRKNATRRRFVSSSVSL